ncbi:AraC family transcriptional regulator [Ahrensia kielensis]|uniref:AraC family transcriptional regulator n=1 Tax=Ahrensia kielensis TaxID=76980 RepID=A0ABU9T3W6_9HYPH
MTDTPTDPLSSVIALLKPQPSISKIVEASGQWQVERHDMASPFYCAVVSGRCYLKIPERDVVTLNAGDFVLIPDIHRFTMSSSPNPPPHAPHLPLKIGPGTFHLGPVSAPVELRALIGHCQFKTPERELLLSLLPEMIHVSGHNRLMALVHMIHEETSADRPARSMILERLLEVLMVDAVRSTSRQTLPPGMLRSMSDPQLSSALHRIHADAAQALSIGELARDAGMSRSGFFERFRKEVGSTPMEYVTAWRMAVARDLLLRGGLSNNEIALRVGYGSASAFGMVFSRHHGFSPSAFIKIHRELT